MARQQTGFDPWALLKYAEHCRLGGNPRRTARLRAKALATSSEITIAALEAEMPPPGPIIEPAPRRKPRRQDRPSFADGHHAFLEREREQRAARLRAKVGAM